MPGKVKHIPENSISIIIKFQTMEELSRLMQDEEFQKCKGRLENISLQRGGIYESFTN